MAISKVVYGNDTLMDITDSTVDASNMLNGTVGYSSAGERTVGTYVPPTVNNNTIKVQVNTTDFTNNTFTLNQSTDKTIDIPVTKSTVGLGNVPNVTTNNQKPTFTQASTRANLVSNTDTLSTIMGKIMKWFADLKDLAFIAKDGTSSTKYLRGDGQWVAFPTIPTKTSDLTNDSGYLTSIPLAANGTRGGIQLGYSQTGKNYPVQLNSEKAYVNVPWTDTTYTGDGLISVNASTHVISTTAEANQNAFSNVKVGSTTIAADAKQDTLTIAAGDNITLTPDATNDKVTIAATDTTYQVKSAASGGTDESLVTTGEKYTWNNKLNLSGGTLTGNFILKRTSQKTASADPDTPAQLQLQTVWNDASTTPAGSAVTANSYLRAYSDRGGGNNVVLTTGANLFIGSGEAPPTHYSEWRNTEGRTLTTEHTFLTSDNQIYLQAGANTIANRTGFRMDVASNEPRIIPCKADAITNNIGMIGHSSYKFKHGYFTYLNNNTVPVTSSAGGDTLALKSDLDWKSVSIGYQSSDFMEVCPTTCREMIFDFYGLGATGSTQIPCYTSLHLTTRMVTAAERTYRTGWYQSNGNGGKATVVVKSANNKIYAKFIEFYINTSNVPSGSCTAYYR